LKTGPVGHVIYSFVIDAQPRFAYQGFYLARSLVEHAKALPADVHVQFTPGVDQPTRNIFSRLGCTLHDMPRFGDGKYCNKIGQLDQLRDTPFDHAVLLDTDMIAVGDPRPFVGSSRVLSKTVDLSLPNKIVLRTIATSAGMPRLPRSLRCDTGDQTFFGNCNGGFYVVPKPLADALSKAWQKWAIWLLEHIEPLKNANKTHHVDQVSFWLALHMEKIPFELVGANLNYFCHVDRPHLSFDPSGPIFFLHYHDGGLDPAGRVRPVGAADGPLATAVNLANQLIDRNPLPSG
jgi:hypothetical protein